MEVSTSSTEFSGYFKARENLAKRADGSLGGTIGYRTPFMRDRDRVLYAAAFRRLAGKTQIYTVNAVDDHRKNRLTHTLEVAQIARTIAKGLHLNEDLAEAIALGHDLGHTPFGHAGEETLHAIMTPKIKRKTIALEGSPFSKRSFGDMPGEITDPVAKKTLGYAYGFKHNIQSVRVAAMLENGYRSNDEYQKNLGLNLTNYALYGMLIHSKLKYNSEDTETDFAPNFYHEFDDQLKLLDSETPAWSFEAFIVEYADDIAQWHHDLEDALLDGIMPIEKVCKTVQEALMGQLDDDRKKKLGNMKNTNGLLRHNVTTISSIVVDTLVTNLVRTSQSNFKSLAETLGINENSSDEAKNNIFTKCSDYYSKLVASDKIDPKYKEKIKNTQDPKDIFGWVISFSGIDIPQFKTTIKNWIHHSRNVERMNAKGQYIIKKLFARYLEKPQLLPDGSVFHFMVDTNTYYMDNIWTADYKSNTDIQQQKVDESEKYATLDNARAQGIGAARAAFTARLKEANLRKNDDDVYLKCVLMRRICDHIASMTDRYATEEYKKLYG